MDLNINEMTAGRHYEHRISGVAPAAERGTLGQTTERAQMTDSVSTSAWARMASGVLRQMREEGDGFRMDKVERFKFLAEEGLGGGSVPAPDEMADSIFSRMFG